MDAMTDQGSGQQVAWAAPAGQPRKLNGGGLIALVSYIVSALVIGFVAGRHTAPTATTAPATTTAAATSQSTSDTSAAAGQVPGGSPALDAALALHTAGKLDEAVAAYKAILTGEPANKFALYNLGQIAQQRGNADEAATDYQAALKADANYVPALYNLSIIRAAKGDAVGAIALLRTAVAAEPGNANANFNLGKLLVSTGSDQEGADYIAKAVAIDPALKP
jgi:tetratricopeptide (TPR) repeat protein